MTHRTPSGWRYASTASTPAEHFVSPIWHAGAPQDAAAVVVERNASAAVAHRDELERRLIGVAPHRRTRRRTSSCPCHRPAPRPLVRPAVQESRRRARSDLRHRLQASVRGDLAPEHARYRARIDLCRAKACPVGHFGTRSRCRSRSVSKPVRSALHCLSVAPSQRFSPARVAPTHAPFDNPALHNAALAHVSTVSKQIKARVALLKRQRRYTASARRAARRRCGCPEQERLLATASRYRRSITAS